MGDWQFVVFRPGTWDVLDRDALLHEGTYGWPIDGPAWGTVVLPSAAAVEVASDGQNTWSKWNTIVIPIEDGVAKAPLVCIDVNPEPAGTKLTFTGFTGWLQGVPFTDQIKVWETEVFTVVRDIVAHAITKTPNLPISCTPNASSFTVGDPKPPAKPKKPNRRKRESKKAYKESNRYTNWVDDLNDWKNTYGEHEKYRLDWWEAPYCGEEIASLAEEVGFNYREDVVWDPNANTAPVFQLTLADNMWNVRSDIKFVNGENMSAPINADDSGFPFAKQLIGLGAGEGRKMRYRQTSILPGTELYQGRYLNFKSVRRRKRLRKLIERRLPIYADTYSNIDEVQVWDLVGAASISTVLPGDVVEIIDPYASPKIATWRRIVEVVRSPVGSVATVRLETQQ